MMEDQKHVRSGKRVAVVVGLCVVVLAFAGMLAACSSKGDSKSSAEATSHTYQEETYQMGSEDKDTVDYLKKYPFLTTVYEGSAFAKSYDSPRGHNYAIEDVEATPRISDKTKATCYACKTAKYSEMEKEQGEALYATSFESLRGKMTPTISCDDCHGIGAEPTSEVVSIRSHFNNAFGDLVERGRIDKNNAVCGQCHNEYYFDPTSGGAVALPKHLTSAEDILAYYNEINFSDYENPRTGTQQLKVQHPEFQMLSGSMHDKFGTTCVDCHMEKNKQNGEMLTSHNIVSPLESDIIMNDVCLSCHGSETKESLTARTRDIQKGVEDKTVAGGELLKELANKLAEANQSGALSKAQLDKVRSLHRDSQWYWDYVFVENSDGFHNPARATSSLDKSAALAKEALELLASK